MPQVLSQPGKKLRALELWSAISALALIAGSYRLWFPQLAESMFPLIPLFQFFCPAPLWLDSVGSAVLCGGWLLVLFGSRRFGYGCILLSGLLLVSLNQHRLQPWHYQLWLFALVFSSMSMASQTRVLRGLIVSIYFFSAISKLDYEFLHTVGQQFLEQLLSFIGQKGVLSFNTKTALAAAFPLIELALAIGLLIPKTRRVAGVGVCVMHGLLLWLLGPWGLNHSLGVLLWNIHFMGVAVFLFVWPSPAANAAEKLSSRVSDGGESVGADAKNQAAASTTGTARTERLWSVAPRDWLATPILILAVAMPLGERSGWWDHWLSWALYAPHSSRVEIFVAGTAAERLPESLQEVMQASDESSLWYRIPLGAWSLQTLGVPIYPQSRFQLGVARWVADKLESEFAIRADVLSAASRWNGQRMKRQFQGQTGLRRAAKQFWFSTCPRQPAA